MIKYFHELTQEEFDNKVDKRMTWLKCGELYPQPDWCNYPDAVCGDMGCLSLMSFRIHTVKDCGDCECIDQLQIK
jgi:hypothetical protein